MPEYEMRLRFTAANGTQAERLAQAWAGTCAAEYGTRYAGLSPTDDPYCDWCGRAIYQGTYEGEPVWLAVKGEERGYDPLTCEVSEDVRHEPANQAAQR